MGRSTHLGRIVRRILSRSLRAPMNLCAVRPIPRTTTYPNHGREGHIMRINQNIQAFNAYRNLSTTNTQMGKSLEKLSSGFRINRAADDAAGLVISQGLRAQVSGLKQATRNAQDGISVVQTAEGALNEVHSMLNRMRDLAVQSVNASNDAEARGAANNEITELKGEISRIAQQTKFGSQALLDGSFGATPGTTAGAVASNSIAVAASSTI